MEVVTRSIPNGLYADGIRCTLSPSHCYMPSVPWKSHHIAKLITSDISIGESIQNPVECAGLTVGHACRAGHPFHDPLPRRRRDQKLHQHSVCGTSSKHHRTGHVARMRRDLDRHHLVHLLLHPQLELYELGHLKGRLILLPQRLSVRAGVKCHRRLGCVL